MNKITFYLGLESEQGSASMYPISSCTFPSIKIYKQDILWLTDTLETLPSDPNRIRTICILRRIFEYIGVLKSWRTLFIVEPTSVDKQR